MFLGGDFNLGDINWATGGTIPGGRNISQSNIMINVLNNFYLEQINDLPTRSDRIFDLMITSHPTLATRTTHVHLLEKATMIYYQYQQI
jgi:hypothetical protein